MDQRKPFSHIAAGLIIAGTLILCSFALMLAQGTGSSPGGGWLSYLVIIGGLIIFIYLYGKAKNNYVTFGELFTYGFKTTTMLTLVFVIFVVIIAVTVPQFKEKAIESARAEMERQKQLADSDIDKGMNLMTKYFWPFIIGGIVLGFVVVGAIGSLIGAGITKKRPVNPIDQLDR
jgi:NADH:ubiquinone oxidoreductase subunit 6 (subunit J)